MTDVARGRFVRLIREVPIGSKAEYRRQRCSNLMTVAHLLAAIPNGTYAECIHLDRDRIFSSLASDQPKVASGLYQPPRRVGSGMELDKHLINRYRA